MITADELRAAFRAIADVVEREGVIGDFTGVQGAVLAEFLETFPLVDAPTLATGIHIGVVAANAAHLRDMAA